MSRCCWAPPCFETVRQLRVGPGFTPVAQVRGEGFMHSADVHIQTNGVLLDGATVRLYAVIGNVETLLAESVIGDATLSESLTDANDNVTARRGIIVGASGHLAEAFEVRISSDSLVTNGGQLTVSGWGQ